MEFRYLATRSPGRARGKETRGRLTGVSEPVDEAISVDDIAGGGMGDVDEGPAAARALSALFFPGGGGRGDFLPVSPCPATGEG